MGRYTRTQDRLAPDAGLGDHQHLVGVHGSARSKVPPSERNDHDQLRHRHPPDRRGRALRRRRRCRPSCAAPRSSASRAAGPRSRCSATSPTSRRWRRWPTPRRARRGSRLGCAVLVSTLHSPAAPRPQRGLGRPAERRSAGGRHRHRGWVPPVRRLRRRPGHVRRPLQRGAGADAQAVDRGSHRPRRALLAAVRRGDGAQARAAPASADLVRRRPSGRAAARRCRRRRVLRRRLADRRPRSSIRSRIVREELAASRA